jgi:hypothetical protein
MNGGRRGKLAMCLHEAAYRRRDFVWEKLRAELLCQMCDASGLLRIFPEWKGTPVSFQKWREEICIMPDERQQRGGNVKPVQLVS